VKFPPPEAFQPPAAAGYRLLPFRFGRVPSRPNEVLVTGDSGRFAFLSDADFQAFARHQLAPHSNLALDLEGLDLLHRGDGPVPLDRHAVAWRTRKAFVFEGPSLHLFVVSLRCHHSCQYCQVSRQPEGGAGFDMDEGTARAAVDRLFESPARQLTVEFQGGEPLLAFDRVRAIVDDVVERNRTARRTITFVLASTLHGITAEQLAFFREHRFELSTSLDGPETLHNLNRPTPTRDSYARTMVGLAAAREALGAEHVNALTTLTRASLAQPEAIVDHYIEQGFTSIFLRPLSPYGFAKRGLARQGYSTAEFLAFYRRALSHLIRRNLEGHAISEAYATLLLTSILTPFAHGYVDLRSPAGAGLGVLVYDHTGKVYPSDEARMLAAEGDERFCLGSVHQHYRDLMLSEPMQAILAAGVTESLPGCSDCAFQPYCGADPVDAYARQGDVHGYRPTSAFCARQTGMFELLFGYLREGDPDVLRVFQSWVQRRNPSEMRPERPEVFHAAA
jgi:His-Xaa-Ser system radical SAM maturase HxsB